MSARRGIELVLLGGLLGCGGAPAAEPVEIPKPAIARAPSATAAPAGVAPEPESCRIAGRGSDDDPEVLISASEAQGDVFAVLDPGSAEVAWTELDARGERAAIEIQSGPVRLHGWATTQGQRFHLRERTDVRTRHVYLVRGAAIDQRDGVAGGRLRFRARTGFEDPSEVVVQTDCDNLGYGVAAGPKEALPSGGRAVVADKGRLELRESPGAPPFLVVTLKGRETLTAFEEEAGFVHVVQRPTEDLVVDAWVQQAELAPRDPASAHGRLAGCKQANPPVVRFHRQPVPFSSISKDAELRASASPDAKVLGTLVAGTEVRVGAAEGALVAVDPYEASVRPPRKPAKRFWVPRASLGPVQDEMVDCRSMDCEDFVRPSRAAPPKATASNDTARAKPCARDR